ncbi:MAG: GNAT family N-acetyltransferase [Spirochaetota bacterium]
MAHLSSVRQSNEKDIPSLLDVHLQAFGTSEGPEIVDLVSQLFEDTSAYPLLSLVADRQGSIVGHVLFSAAELVPEPSPEILEHTPSVRILAPLAVLPQKQSNGIGGLLIEQGLNQLKNKGVELVCVLGHPTYYRRFGFKPALALGFRAPHPIAPAETDAWMIQELKPGIISQFQGFIRCSDTLGHPRYWR